jgi:hypothetical protein
VSLLPTNIIKLPTKTNTPHAINIQSITRKGLRISLFIEFSSVAVILCFLVGSFIFGFSFTETASLFFRKPTVQKSTKYM